MQLSRIRSSAAVAGLVAGVALAACGEPPNPFDAAGNDAALDTARDAPGGGGDGRGDIASDLGADAGGRDAPALDAPPSDAPPPPPDARASDASPDGPRGDGAVACTPPASTATQASCATAGTPGCGLVEVAPGMFTMGDPMAIFASPVQPVTITSTLLVDAYEVTVARFRAYWSAGHPAACGVGYPGGRVLTIDAMPTEPLLATGATPYDCTWRALDGGTRDAQPINCVDWWTAQAFCAWDGGRLPTEAEWEWIARGRAAAGLTVPRAYPWGDQDPMGSATTTCDRAQAFGCAGEDGAPTRRVGAFAASAGTYEMAGNVAEWVADYYGDFFAGGPCWNGTPRTDPICLVMTSRGRSVRGGGYDAIATAMVRAASRVSFQPSDAQSAAIGFRCVRSR